MGPVWMRVPGLRGCHWSKSNWSGSNSACFRREKFETSRLGSQTSFPVFWSCSFMGFASHEVRANAGPRHPRTPAPQDLAGAASRTLHSFTGWAETRNQSAVGSGYLARALCACSLFLLVSLVSWWFNSLHRDQRDLFQLRPSPLRIRLPLDLARRLHRGSRRKRLR